MFKERKNIQKIISYFFLIFITLLIISCKEKDDKDFIIDFLKEAKNGNLDKMSECFSFEFTSKESLISNAEYLIKKMKDAKMPDKNKIINTINNGEYQSYDFTLEPMKTKCMIRIKKDNKSIKIIDLFCLKDINLNPELFR